MFDNGGKTIYQGVTKPGMQTEYPRYKLELFSSIGSVTIPNGQKNSVTEIDNGHQSKIISSYTLFFQLFIVSMASTLGPQHC